MKPSQRIDDDSYASREYGATAEELKAFAKRTHEKLAKSRKAGKLHEFFGDIEALIGKHLPE